MLLRDLNLSALSYLERYVNDGSPSGFTGLYTTSPDTSPFGLTAFVRPYVCTAPAERFNTFGRIPHFKEVGGTGGDNWLLVHPDMKDTNIFHSEGVTLVQSDEIHLVPTASGRTLAVATPNARGYFKLHYDGILGRISRDLGFKKAVSGPEISSLLVSLIDAKKLDSRLMLLREPGARIFRGISGNTTVEWGMVWREGHPYNMDLNAVRHILPVFSLFGRDRRAERDMPLLAQIIAETAVDPTAYVMERLLFPMIECYFSMLKNAGIQPEWHAQNLLVALADDFTPVGLIMRDLESMDKDITLMESINLNVGFESHPFKCIWRGQWNYRIKHSFMYDYKFGEYVLQPLLDFLKRTYGIRTSPLMEEIKHYSKRFIDDLPADFFPRGWYVFERVLIDQSTDRRPYLRKRNPKFRF